MTDEVAQSEPRTDAATVCPRCQSKPCTLCDGTGRRKATDTRSAVLLPICTYCYNEPCPDCGQR